MATLAVLVSHYFGEVPNGVKGVMFGWIAVDVFFVLSGFLIGKLILDKKAYGNFFVVFYVRRFCRIIPAFVVTVLVVHLLLRIVSASWSDASEPLPLWSYLTFTNTFLMISTHGIGAHWLAPTWTLAVEEHFYLVIPALLVFTPRRLLTPVLTVGCIAAVCLRIAIYHFGLWNEMAALVLLPSRADILLCGVLSAVAIRNPSLFSPRLDQALRAAPLVLLVAVFGLKLAGGKLFEVWGPLLIAVACAAFLLAVVRGAPEARRFESRALQFIGNNGYCIYLTHLPVLGLAHGLALGVKPGLATAEQWVITLAALPLAIVVGWAMTAVLEDPLTRYGRTWRWGEGRGTRLTADRSSQAGP